MVLVIYTLMVGALVSYVISKLREDFGSWFNFLVGSIAFMLLMRVPSNGEAVLARFVGDINLSLRWTPLSKYFTFVSFLVILSVMFFSTKWVRSFKYPSAFNAFLLLMTAGSVGVFMAEDFLTLYIFWEIAVFSSLLIVPMGKEESRKAAVVYAVLSSIGSYMYLYATFLIHSKFQTLNIYEVSKKLIESPTSLKISLFLLIASAGIAKSGVFPLHTWLRIAHGNAPDAFSAVLSGQLIKMGSYVLTLSLGILPSLIMFKDLAVYSGIPAPNYLLIAFGALSIIIGTLMAIKQDDMKMLIAFSSVANSGYILIGLGMMDQVGTAGGLMHVLNHALAAAMIFLSFSAVIYRTKTTKISELGGLIHRMPITFVVYLVAIISLAGIPPMSGFVSKWMIFQALVRKGMFLTAFTVFFGSIGSFLYVFRPLAGVFLGQLPDRYKNVREVPWQMILPMVFLVLLTILYGVLPSTILGEIAKVEEFMGLKPIEFTFSTIKTPIGGWNTILVFVMFFVGFMIAGVLYMVFPKQRKVGLLDTYTAGEYIYTAELYHYSSKYYRPFERLYENHPSIEKLYEMFARFFEHLGEFVHRLFFKPSPSVYVFWLIVVMIFVFKVRW